jgi:filamentous hemagglutinin family protein
LYDYPFLLLFNSIKSLKQEKFKLFPPHLLRLTTRSLFNFMKSIIFRSKKNAHRLFYFLNDTFKSFVTFEKDVLSNVAELFGSLNANFSAKTMASVSLLTLLTLSGVSQAPVYALPDGGVSVAGGVTFSQTGNTLDVNATGNRSIANYNSFNVANGETVNFNLPNASSAILNRVIGGNPSQIFGAINSNGQVFLTNPSGVLFGNTSQVNVGSLFATTLGITDANFLSGNLVFNRDPLSRASVVNDGTINVADGGFAALVASAVSNTGTITAPLGQIHLAVGDQVTLNLGSGLGATVTVDQALQSRVIGVQNAISNSGTLSANGGLVKLQADLQNNFYTRLVNNTGLVEANSVVSKNGEISFVGSTVSGTGIVLNSGTLNANGTLANGDAGQISVKGGDVQLNGGSLSAVSLNSSPVLGSVTVEADRNVNQAAASSIESGSVTLTGANLNLAGNISSVGTGISGTATNNINVANTAVITGGVNTPISLTAGNSFRMNGTITNSDSSIALTANTNGTPGTGDLNIGTSNPNALVSANGKFGTLTLQGRNVLVQGANNGVLGVPTNVFAGRSIDITSQNQTAVINSRVAVNSLGRITINAGTNVILARATVDANRGTVRITADQDANGTGLFQNTVDSQINADRGIVLVSAAQIQQAAAINTGNTQGVLNLTATTGDLSILSTASSSAKLLSVRANNGSILVNSDIGSNGSTTKVEARNNITGTGTVAGSLLFLSSSQGGIGTSALNRLNVNANNINVKATNGNVYLNQTTTTPLNFVGSNSAGTDLFVKVLPPGGSITNSGFIYAPNVVFEF